MASVLISYPYLSDKIPFLPQLNRLRTLRSTDAAAWKVKPGSIYDGDTLRVVRGESELKIRFCGIDAPELKQPLGIESRDYLRSEAMPQAYRSLPRVTAQFMFYPLKRIDIIAPIQRRY